MKPLILLILLLALPLNVMAQTSTTPRTMLEDSMSYFRASRSGSAKTDATISQALTDLSTTNQRVLYLDPTISSNVAINTTWTLSSNIVIPANVTLFIPALITVGGTADLTINGCLVAERNDWWTSSGTLTDNSSTASCGAYFGALTVDSLSVTTGSHYLDPGTYTDFFGPFAIQGTCAPADSVTETLAAFACQGWTNDGVYVDQSSNSIDLSAGSGNTWIAAYKDTSTTVSGCGAGNWTREGSTHYIWCDEETQPSLPTGAFWIANGQEAAGAVTVVDLRRLVPINEDLPYIMPTWLGALCDGSTDDTTAIQNAFVLGNTLSKGVVFPRGATCMTDALTISDDDSPPSVPPWVDGAGATIKAISGASGDMLTIENPHEQYQGFNLKNLNIDGNDEVGVDDGVYVHGASRILIEHVMVLNVPDDCFDFYADAGYGIIYSTFIQLEAGKAALEGCGGDGFQFNTGGAMRTNNNAFISTMAHHVEGHGYNLIQGQSTWINPGSERNNGIGWYIDFVSDVGIFGGYSERNHENMALTDVSDASQDCFIHVTANAADVSIWGGNHSGKHCTAAGVADDGGFDCSGCVMWTNGPIAFQARLSDDGNLTLRGSLRLENDDSIILDNNQSISFEDSGTTPRLTLSVNASDHVILGNTNLGDVRLNVGTLGEAVRIQDTSGEVGIGTTSPDMQLHVEGGAAYGDLKLDGASGGCLMIRDTDDAGWTECTVLNGTMTCTIDADGACDGS